MPRDDEPRDSYGQLRGAPRVGATVPAEVLQRIDAFAERNDEARSRTIRRALIRGIEALEREEKEARKKK